MQAPLMKEFQHPFIVRCTHWVNFAALAIMVLSGLRIYNASPFFPFRIPAEFTLGGWLAGARMWHFFGMWLFVVNGAVYALYNILSRHGRKTGPQQSKTHKARAHLRGSYLRVAVQPGCMPLER